MKSNNSELKALVLSKVGMDEGIWNQYFPKIEEDERAQKRLLELIDMTTLKNGMKILKNWGKSLGVSAEEIKANVNFSTDDILMNMKIEVTIPFYVWYSLQLLILRPNEVVLGLVSTGSFKAFLDKLKYENHLPSESIEFKVRLIRARSWIVNIMYHIGGRLFPKITFDDGNFDSKMVVLKTASKILPLSSDSKSFVLKKTLNMAFGELYSFNEEEIMKIYRAGFVEIFSSYFNNAPRANMSEESVMKVGVLAARFVVEIASSPTKYSWATPKAVDILLETARTAIEICRISYYSDKPITNALKYAFESGILVEFYSRNSKYDSFTQFIRLVCDVYSRETKLFFAYKKFLGDKFYSNLDPRSPLYKLYNSVDTLANFKNLAYHFTKRREQ